MYCKKCGNEINDESEFCSCCGEKLKKAVEVNSPDTINNEEAQYKADINSNSQTVAYKKPKSKIVAGILGILLGGLGVHNFYLGYYGKGIAQLILSLGLGWLTCLSSSAIATIWGLIEGIMILCGKIDKDGDGNLLGD